MKKDPEIFLKHILESINFIESFSKNLIFEQFIKNKLRQNAIVRELEIIGEAVKNLSSIFTDKHPTVEWGKIAGLRDKLIHNYFGVDLKTVWNVVKEDLQKLKKQIQQILDKLSDQK